MGFAYYWSILTLLCSLSVLCSAATNITEGQSILDGETIVSPAGKFALGFFSPGNSTSRYVGIMFNGISQQTVVWVANRESPISGKNGTLSLIKNGVLVVSDGFGNWVWSSNVSSPSNNTIIAMLMDSGNLVISGEDHIGDVDNALWQTFNHPTDTYLPDMRVHTSTKAGETRVLATWKDENDPSPGRYTMGVDPRGSPQVVIWDGEIRRWRSGHWNGVLFIGVPTMPAIYLYGFKIYYEGGDNYYLTYISSNTSDLVRFQLQLNGNEEQIRWDHGTKQWEVIQTQPANECEIYNRCGSFGKCSWGLSPICSCLEGFVPKNQAQWVNGDWSGGCVRRTELGCVKNGSGTGLGNGGGDVFLKLKGVKVPDFADLIAAENSEDCEEKCLKNCSCHAYAYVRGINCMIWSGDLMDVQHFREGDTNLLIRVASSELGKKTKVSKLVIIITVVVGIFFISVSIWLLCRCRTKAKALSLLGKDNPPAVDPRSRELSTDCSGADDRQSHNVPDLSMFSFSEVVAFTNNFSDENKLGKGGFGSVYKGTLSGGEEIAVKRLSKTSGQGIEEYTNEIILIAKLQHMNLVRLLGCCIDGDERMLLYEYMPNKSLDSFLFDPVKRAQLDWGTRFSIIEGIARGLLYLHRDSRLRIIHRDLKASNILLDEDMTPKISDFGMAKIFGRNENQASTSRVVGTYGYMAPEYAMEGLFSVKSDVYSFGVLLLEIVSGRRNSSFRTHDYSNIIGYAWDLWERGKAMEMIDPCIADSSSKHEILRCIHIAMLCVHDSAIHRPIMSSVVLMLECESTALPLPRPRTTTSTRVSSEIDELVESSGFRSENDLTLSVILGR